MTEERKTPDPGVADDPRVSDVYREMATERTPEHLDQAVLREAASAARPRYWRLRLWTRPAAWAAIVLLSATLLLQVSQVQPPQDTVPAVLELEDRAARRELAEPEASAERQRNDLGSAAKATGTTVPRQEQPAAELFEAVAEQDAEPSCDERARETPRSWLDCIAELEEAGLAAAADRERELLAETFPDFETP